MKRGTLSRRCWTRLIVLVVVGAPLVSENQRGMSDDAPQVSAEDDARLIARVEGFPDWVTSVAVSPGGELIAAGSFEHVRLIAPDGTTLHRWNPGAGFVRSLAFSPDGKRLLTGGYSNLTSWQLDADNAEPPTEGEPFVGHRGYVEDIEFSSDGKHIATGGEDGTARIWDGETQAETARYAGDGTPVLSVAFSPDTQFLAAADGDETRLSRKGRVMLLNAGDLKIVRELPVHESAATSVCFTSDGKFVLTGSVDERVHVVDPLTGEAHGFFGAHSRPVNCLAVTGDGRIAVSGSGGRFQEKNEVKFWDPVEGTEWLSIEPHAGKVNDLAVTRDGRLLVTGSNDKAVALVDPSGIIKRANEAAAEPVE